MSHAPLATPESLDHFLAGVERRALRMARISTGNHDAALDIVQDAMLKLVRKYSHRPSPEWAPLFFRILGNTTTDWHRHQQRSGTIFDRWFGSKIEDESALENLPSPASHQPEQVLNIAENMATVEATIAKLSARQQQAFMLRCWQGFSTAETATAMGCTEGTVKTLYSRAMQTLRVALTAATPMT
jgi:RNA polymerase sigma-70 factor (ECF subfamily)